METRERQVGDFLWYSRLLVWIGCGALLVEALSGTSFGYLTVLAVIFLIVGFLGFLGSLTFSGGWPAWLSALAEVPVLEEEAPESRDVVSGARSADIARPATTGTVAPPPSAPPVQERPAAIETRTVPTRELDAADPEVGQLCPQCGHALDAGQIVAVCWSCRTAQHASCWTESGFRCATPGCDGAGRLEAPVGGPSKP